MVSRLDLDDPETVKSLIMRDHPVLDACYVFSLGALEIHPEVALVKPSLAAASPF